MLRHEYFNRLQTSEGHEGISSHPFHLNHGKPIKFALSEVVGKRLVFKLDRLKHQDAIWMLVCAFYGKAGKRNG